MYNVQCTKPRAIHCPLSIVHYELSISIRSFAAHSGGLAQLARAPALQAGGQRFESVILHSRGRMSGVCRPPRGSIIDMLGKKRKARLANQVDKGMRILDDDFTSTAESIRDDGRNRPPRRNFKISLYRYDEIS